MFGQSGPAIVNVFMRYSGGPFRTYLPMQFPSLLALPLAELIFAQQQPHKLRL